MPPIKINHVAVVVENVQIALDFWEKALGLVVEHIEHNAEEAVEIAFLPLGEGEIELIAPTTGDSGVARYLSSKGAGLHHICIEVEDIESAMQQIADSGAELINEAPKTNNSGRRYAFVHPRSTGGVLVELYETLIGTQE
jgi:methylmalonyl-CoA/ethylmalonyl-CoA epimerase